MVKLCPHIQAVAAALVLAETAHAQWPASELHANFSAFWNVTDFPNQQRDNVTKYLNQARAVAGTDLYDFFVAKCIVAEKYPTLSSLGQANGFVDPAMAFDGIWFVGQSAVSSWAFETGDGLVVIDSLDNADEAQHILIPGIESLGYTGHDIKALFITHEHFDHFGGARYIQDTYGTPIYASDIAWDDMLQYESEGGPRRSMTISDGQVMTFGNLTLRFVATPGHTPGCMSMFFNVTDHGQKHQAVLYGGGAPNSTADGKDAQINSYYKVQALAKAANIDTHMSNHQQQDFSLWNFDLLNYRQCSNGHCQQPNPYVIGQEPYQRLMDTLALCIRVQAARDGQIIYV